MKSKVYPIFLFPSIVLCSQRRCNELKTKLVIRVKLYWLHPCAL